MSTTQRRIALLTAVILFSGGCGARDAGRNTEGAQAPQDPGAQTAPPAPSPDPLADASAPTIAESAPAAAGGEQAPSSNPAPTGSAPPGAAAPRTQASSPNRSAIATSPSAAGSKKSEPGSPAKKPGSGSPAAPTPNVPAPGGPKSEIVLGSIGTSSGPVGATVATALTGTKAWLADVNTRGGLAGRPVRIVFGDDGGDPQRALALARNMVEQQKAIAFINHYGPTTLSGYMPYLEQNRIPLLGAEGGSPPIDHSQYGFNITLGNDYGFSWGWILAARASGKKKFGLVYCREVAVCPQARDRIKTMIQQTDMQYAWEAQSSVAQPDYTAEMIAARNQGAEVIATFMPEDAVIRITQAAHRQGFKPAFANLHNVNSDSFLRGGSDVEGMYVMANMAPYATSPKLADMRQAIDRFVPNAPRGQFSAGSWAHGKLLERIAPMLPEPPTSQSIVDALYSLHGEELGGLIPKVTFNRGEHKAVNLCGVMITIKNGKWTALNGESSFVCPPGYVPGDPDASMAALKGLK